MKYSGVCLVAAVAASFLIGIPQVSPSDAGAARFQVAVYSGQRIAIVTGESSAAARRWAFSMVEG
jgi:hypothetical protein